MTDRPNPTQENQFILLPDGRRLGYAEYGEPNGRPVLFFHGAPGSRHIHTDMSSIAAQHDIRLIAPERPGYGLSDPKPGRLMLDWPDDIALLADALGITQFAIIGFSGGSPYTLACAYRLPSRVTKIALVGTLAPLNVPGVMEGMLPAVSGLYALAQANPEELMNTFAAIAHSPTALVEAMAASASGRDRSVINGRRPEFETEYTQTLRSGIEGVASDFVLASRNWGIPLDSINTETYLWCGTADCNTPPAMTAYLASQLSNSHTFMLPDEGHFVIFGHWEEILRQLV